ncbi:MAG: hypothetical protein IJS32_01520 [Kiritimatiellae bacterium]|nr:hypothetical protein [Kiritimatiellia bacterium]
MKRFFLFLLAACLVAGAVSAAPQAPKPRRRKAPPADTLSPVRRVRDALAGLGFSFVPDEGNENVLSLAFREDGLFRGHVRFRLAYHPDKDLLQAQGILSDEDLVAGNVPRAFAFAAERQKATFFPKIIVDTDVPGGALVTEWSWQPLEGLSDKALELNLAVFVSASFGVIREAIEEDIYPSSLAVPGTEEDEDDLADSLEAVFR